MTAYRVPTVGQMSLLMHSLSSITDTSKVWYADSGASNHMCCRKEWFSSFKDIEPLNIYFGTNASTHGPITRQVARIPRRKGCFKDGIEIQGEC